MLGYIIDDDEDDDGQNRPSNEKKNLFFSTDEKRWKEKNTKKNLRSMKLCNKTLNKWKIII